MMVPMREPRSATVFALVLVLIVTPGSALLMAANASQAPSDSVTSDGVLETMLDWSAPADFSGTLAIYARIEATEETRCEGKTTAVGRVDASLGESDQDNPVVFWQQQTSDLGKGSTSHSWVRSHQAHIGPLDTRDLTPVEGRWGASPGFSWVFDDFLELTIAGFGLRLSEGSDVQTPFSITLSCEQIGRAHV